MDKRKLLIIFFILIILFSVFTTTAAEDDSKEVRADKEVIMEEVEGSKDSEEIIGKIKKLTDVNKLLNLFKRLQGNWQVYDDGELVQDTTFTYKYLSKDILMEEETDKISLKINPINNVGMLIYFWISEEEIVQIDLEGQIISKQMVDLMKENLLSSVFAPFMEYQELNVEELKNYGEISRSTEEIGGEELNIIKIEVENISEIKIESGMIKFADFGDFLIVVEYKYKAKEIDQTVSFIVQDIKFR